MSLLIFQRLAEERIQEAIRNGEFDDLPGKGKPLQMEDLSFVPEEVRLAYKVLKNAGFVPPEVELRREIRTLEDLLESLGEEEVEEQYRIMRRLDFLLLKLRETHRRSALLEEDARYYRLVARKVARLREKERRPVGGKIDWSGLSHRLGLKYLAGSFRRRP
ncbi:DUF1992 domain-containing protein [Thermosulfurimonas marina]|uniref:DnaJ family domain-containing protein n=1 Tax=Thermosulfurimonas marina TaxID=2047767 RepID=UPI001B31768C|nr:DUF1992 domain-containing protein [Thermosulfurimonas marina]